MFELLKVLLTLDPVRSSLLHLGNQPVNLVLELLLVTSTLTLLELSFQWLHFQGYPSDALMDLPQLFLSVGLLPEVIYDCVIHYAVGGGVQNSLAWVQGLGQALI